MYQWSSDKTGYRVLWAIYERKNGCGVWHPLGRHKASHASPPLPPFRPPEQHQVEFDTKAEAEAFAADLRAKHGADRVATSVVELGVSRPRPRQMPLI